MKLLFHVILLLSFSFSAFAQDSVSGRVAGENDDGIPFCNVFLKLNERIITGTVTDSKGFYTLQNNIENKNYLLCFSTIGYKDTCISINLNKNKEYSCKLTRETYVLGNVKVVAKRPVITNNGNKTIVKLNQETLNNLETATSVFKYIPGVIKTKNGYQVFGKGSPLILLNGKKALESEINAIQPQNILKIETFDNNGKYDASIQSVINIITKKQELFGGQIYNGLRYYFPEFNNDFRIYLTYNHKKFQQSFFYKNNYGKNPWQESSTNNLYDINANLIFTNDFYMNAIDKNNNHYIYYALNYDIDTNQNIGIRLNGNYGNFSTDYDFISHFNNDVYNNKTNELSNTKDIHGVLNYNITTKKNHTLSIIADVYYNNSNKTTIIEQNIVTDTLNNNIIYSIRSFKADYSLPLKKIKTNMLIGGKVFQTINTNYVDNFYHDKLDNQLTENSYAGYIIFSNKSLKKTTIQLGLRNELFTREIKNISTDSTISFNENKLFPNFSISYKLNSFTNLSFNYKKYIDRSAYSYISNQGFYINPFLYKQSNPYLKPDIINSYSVKASFFNSIQFMAGYKDHNNYTTMFFSNKDSIIIVSYDNTKKQELFLSLSAMAQSENSYTNIGINASYPFFKYTVLGEEKQIDRINFNFSLNNIFSITKSIKSDISLQYSPMSQYDLFLYKPILNLSIGVKKFFFNNKLRLSIYYDYNSTNEYFMQYNQIQLQHKYTRNKNVLLFSLLYKFNFKKWINKNSGIDSEINRIKN